MTAKEDSACQQINSAEWIHVGQIKDQSDKKMYKAKLHEGEVEVMILAQEDEKADLVVTVTGTVGVLLKAKRRGIISEIRPVLNSMKKEGFYISENVEQMMLEQAGER